MMRCNAATRLQLLACIAFLSHVSAFSLTPYTSVTARGQQSQPGQRIPDPYRVLGLADRRAGKEAIRGAFMTLAKTQHPDAGGDADQFMLISQSYELLSDPARRAAYDQAWMQARAGIQDARIMKPPSRAQGLIITFAGLVTGAPVIIPLTLAKFCVEPFASAVKILSKSCPPAP